VPAAYGSIQLTLNSLSRKRTCTYFRDRDDVLPEASPIWMASENLANSSLQVVAGHGTADLPTHSDTEPSRALTALRDEDEALRPPFGAGASQ
jgi:hypothetical protein